MTQLDDKNLKKSPLPVVFFTIIGFVDLIYWGFISAFIPMMFTEQRISGWWIYAAMAMPTIIIILLCVFVWVGYLRDRNVLLWVSGLILIALCFPALITLAIR